MLKTEAIAQFRGTFRGDLIDPSDPRFDAARKVYNGMIDRKPALIAQCSDVADVMAAIAFARANDVRVSIRGGGHNAGGLGIADDALVIDLCKMKFVHVDQATGAVRVGGGATWADVDHATYAFSLAVPCGFISSTGVGGLTLGGGIGHLTRKYGLTIDNLLAADVVLADGTCVVASATENPDLFWAIRGGGGNFGVVTSFLFQGRPVSTVCGGPMLWELDDTEAMMKFYREFIATAPETINGFFAFLTVPPGPPFPEALHFKKMCGIVWCYPGSIEEANKLLDPVRAFRKPAFEFFVPMPFPMLNGMFDGLYPAGLQWYWKGDFFNELSDGAIQGHLKHGAQLPTLHSTMHLYPISGAAHRPSNTDTPWAYRDAEFCQVIVGVDPDPANAGKITDWARNYHDALHPYGAGGAYINFMMEEGDERIRATYKGNYDRLASVKAKYDPANFFRVNQNIRPAAAKPAGA
ncbi:MAG: linked oxidase domain protein [Candidatus Solibacter sp.]|nr:linked oxidase domain protein [Candidatus Solibacter sp.]